MILEFVLIWSWILMDFLLAWLWGNWLNLFLEKLEFWMVDLVMELRLAVIRFVVYSSLLPNWHVCFLSMSLFGPISVHILPCTISVFSMDFFAKTSFLRVLLFRWRTYRGLSFIMDIIILGKIIWHLVWLFLSLVLYIDLPPILLNWCAQKEFPFFTFSITLALFFFCLVIMENELVLNFSLFSKESLENLFPRIFSWDPSFIRNWSTWW